MIKNLVIGSGPTGMAAAQKLTSLGHPIVVADAGKVIEDEITGVAQKLAAKNFRDWGDYEKSEYFNFTSGDTRLSSHIGSKLKFGSKFTYASFDELSFGAGKVAGNISVFPSLAQGGLSHVWGSICFPYVRADESRMRFKISDRHYRQVDQMMPQSGVVDDLVQIYPIYSPLNTPVPHSNLAYSLAAEAPLSPWMKKMRVRSGLPRIAVKSQGANACQACGLCATGCVWGSIWDSTAILTRLKEEATVEYLSGKIATKIQPVSDYYEVHFADGTKVEARRIFLACGPISTAALISRSKLIDDKLSIRDTQLTILPCLSIRKMQSTENFVLSQYIFNLADVTGGTSEFIQITGFNSDLIRRVRTVIPVTRYLPKVFLNFLLRFIAVAMIFQNTDSSGRIEIFSNGDTTMVTPNEEYLKPILKSKRRYKIYSLMIRVKLLPLPFLAQKVGVGESYHVGKLTFGENSPATEDNGRLLNHPNIFVVDSSSLDYIAPGPITYAAMANAIRIIENMDAE